MWNMEKQNKKKKKNNPWNKKPMVLAIGPISNFPRFKKI